MLKALDGSKIKIEKRVFVNDRIFFLGTMKGCSNQAWDLDGKPLCGHNNHSFDFSNIEEYEEGIFGYNKTKGCDTILGPCSCGAWHTEKAEE